MRTTLFHSETVIVPNMARIIFAYCIRKRHFCETQKIPAHNVMLLSQYSVESRRRDSRRRSDNVERLGGGVELGVGSRVGVAHLEVGQFEVVEE